MQSLMRHKADVWRPAGVQGDGRGGGGGGNGLGPVGDGFLGRVIDPLGKPIDALGDIEHEEMREPIFSRCNRLVDGGRQRLRAAGQAADDHPRCSEFAHGAAEREHGAGEYAGPR